MKRRDFHSGLLLLVLGLIIIEESMRLHIGTPQEPGAGFYPLLIGIAIAGLSVLLLAAYLWSGRNGEALPFKTAKASRLGKLAMTIGALLVYIFALEGLGFLLTTLLFMIFMLKTVEGMKWTVALLTSLFTATACYLLFDLLLQAQMPPGLLRYFPEIRHWIF
jgi:putative tricarboxylic transport membrane protein